MKSRRGEVMEPIIVTTSCGSMEEAERIARRVVEARLVACVQVAVSRSIYRWKGALESEDEHIVTMKSKKSLFIELSEQIRQIHSYEVPEIIATDIVMVDQPYRNWLKSELNGVAGNG